MFVFKHKFHKRWFNYKSFSDVNSFETPTLGTTNRSPHFVEIVEWTGNCKISNDRKSDTYVFDESGMSGCILLIDSEWRICASVYSAIIDLKYGLSPIRHQAIVYTNTVVLLITWCKRISRKRNSKYNNVVTTQCVDTRQWKGNVIAFTVPLTIVRVIYKYCTSLDGRLVCQISHLKWFSTRRSLCSKVGFWYISNVKVAFPL